MRQQARQQADLDILKQIRKGFARFRGDGSGSRKRCPDDLRNLVLAAVKAGHTAISVAEAAGIHPTGIGRWRREDAGERCRRSLPKARELRIVKRREDEPKAQAAATATLRIGRHVAIDLPIAAVTDSLVRALLATAGGEA